MISKHSPLHFFPFFAGSLCEGCLTTGSFMSHSPSANVMSWVGNDRISMPVELSIEEVQKQDRGSFNDSVLLTIDSTGNLVAHP